MDAPRPSAYMTTQIRLLKPYRGYRSGQVIATAEKVAAVLVAEGRAVVERQVELFAEKTPERAVASAVGVETR